MDNNENEEERPRIAEQRQIIQQPPTRPSGTTQPAETQPEQGVATSRPPGEAMQSVQRLQAASRRSDRLADVFKNVPAVTIEEAAKQKIERAQREGE